MSQWLTDLVNNPAMGNSIPPKSISSTTNGTGLDLNDGTFDCNAIINIGATTGLTSATVRITEATTQGAAYTEITGMTQAISANASNQQVKLRGLRTKRWARAEVSAFSGASMLVSADIIEQPRFAPQSGGFDASPST